MMRPYRGPALLVFLGLTLIWLVTRSVDDDDDKTLDVPRDTFDEEILCRDSSKLFNGGEIWRLFKNL